MTRKAVVIEDNANNRYLLGILLRNAGFSVVELADGKAAVATVRREAPDVVLLDIQMPDMDGYEVAAALKLDPVAARIPIVGVSSFAMPGDRERALKAGFASYLEKPVDPDRFAESILSILGLTGGAK
jgi:CheY-like chemotaxis protein